MIFLNSYIIFSVHNLFFAGRVSGSWCWGWHWVLLQARCQTPCKWGRQGTLRWIPILWVELLSDWSLTPSFHPRSADCLALETGLSSCPCNCEACLSRGQFDISCQEIEGVGNLVMLMLLWIKQKWKYATEDLTNLIQSQPHCLGKI